MSNFAVITVSLQNPHDEKGASTYDAVKPVGYCAIVGRGVAAWYNHLTLLQSEWGQKRLKKDEEKLPVIHVGFKDPWSRRKDERMGQWPRMLNFFAQLDHEDEDDEALGLPTALLPDNNWLRSDLFAASVEKVEAYIRKRYDVVMTDSARETGTYIDQTLLRIKNGFVGIVERQDTFAGRTGLPAAEAARRDAALLAGPREGIWANKDCTYRLSVFYKKTGAPKATVEYIYAHKIDICSGVSHGRKPDEKWLKDASVKDAYEKAFEVLDEVPKRRTDEILIDGNHYIGSDNEATDVVVVFKDGAVAAQSVQSALEMPKFRGIERVWWVSNKDFFTDLRKPGAKPAASVPGARNQLEIVGCTPDEYLEPERAYQISELNTHFSMTANPVFRPAKVNRVTGFKNKLYNLKYHELEALEEDGGRLKCTFGLRPRGDPGKPEDESVRPKAIASLARVVADAGGDDEFAGKDDIETVGADETTCVKTITADVLVYTSGQDYNKKWEGTPAYMIQILAANGGFQVILDEASTFPKAITDKITDTDVDKLDAKDVGCVRILGGAAVAAWGGRVVGKEWGDGHDAHWKTLPQEAPAAGGGGINPSLVNIHRANHYTYPKTKLNTSSIGELKAAGFGPYAANAIIGRRKLTVRGFTVAEWAEELDRLSKDELFLIAVGNSDEVIRQLQAAATLLAVHPERFTF